MLIFLIDFTDFILSLWCRLIAIWLPSSAMFVAVIIETRAWKLNCLFFRRYMYTDIPITNHSGLCSIFLDLGYIALKDSFYITLQASVLH